MKVTRKVKTADGKTTKQKKLKKKHNKRNTGNDSKCRTLKTKFSRKDINVKETTAKIIV